MNFSEKIVYITGGGSGIGLETAKRLLGEGSRVAVFDLKLASDALKSLQGTAAKEKVRAYQIDVTNAGNVKKVFAKAVKEIGLPDIVFNSAGIVSAAEMLSVSQKDWERVILVNLHGSKNIAFAAGNLLKPGGRLVLVASLAGIVGSYGYSAYAASKFGVVGLAQVLRMEWKPRGIGVSVICPPEVETPMVVYERTVRPKATSALKAFAGALSVQEAVTAILAGLRKEKFMIIPGFRAKLTHLLVRFAPLWLNHAISDGMVKKALNDSSRL